MPLAAHDCLVGFRPDGAPDPHWPLRAGGTFAVHGPVSSNEMDFRLQAAVDGLGIALVVDRIARWEVDADRLVRVLEDEVGQDWKIAVVYPDRAFLEPKVRVFVDLVVERFRALAEDRPA